MYVGKKGYSGTYCHHSGCNDIHSCQNNKCYWRQRDVFGMNPWWVADPNDPANILNQEIRDQCGECYFPKIQSCVCTNDMIFYCEDFIPTEDFKKKLGL